MAAGFVHGVLNTDNMNITGESFDYGPWRFLPTSTRPSPPPTSTRPASTAFGRQPEALNWNLARLGECLLGLSTRAAIEPVFESFPDRFQAELARQTFARLGLLVGDPEPARALMHRFWAKMQATAPPFQQVFHDLVGGGLPERLRQSPLRPLFETAAWAEVVEGLRALPPAPGLAAAAAHPAARDVPETMVIAEVEAIWSAIDRDDDWQPLADKIARIRETGAMGAALGLLTGPNARPGMRPLPDGRQRPATTGRRPRPSGRRQEHLVDHVDHAVRLLDVGDRHVGDVAAGRPRSLIVPPLIMAVNSQPPTVFTGCAPPSSATILAIASDMASAATTWQVRIFDQLVLVLGLQAASRPCRRAAPRRRRWSGRRR